MKIEWVVLEPCNWKDAMVPAKRFRRFANRNAAMGAAKKALLNAGATGVRVERDEVFPTGGIHGSLEIAAYCGDRRIPVPISRTGELDRRGKDRTPALTPSEIRQLGTRMGAARKGENLGPIPRSGYHVPAWVGSGRHKNK